MEPVKGKIKTTDWLGSNPLKEIHVLLSSMLPSIVETYFPLILSVLNEDYDSMKSARFRIKKKQAWGSFGYVS